MQFTSVKYFTQLFTPNSHHYSRVGGEDEGFFYAISSLELRIWNDDYYYCCSLHSTNSRGKNLEIYSKTLFISLFNISRLCIIYGLYAFQPAMYIFPFLFPHSEYLLGLFNWVLTVSLHQIFMATFLFIYFNHQRWYRIQEACGHHHTHKGSCVRGFIEIWFLAK